MKLGQTVHKPQIHELKKRYTGIFDFIEQKVGNDEEVKALFESDVLYLEWHDLFLERINHDAGGKLSVSDQANIYRKFTLEIENKTRDMAKYYLEYPIIDLPDDKGSIIQKTVDKLERIGKDSIETDAVIEELKKVFDIKRVRTNKRYEQAQSTKEMIETIQDHLSKKP